MSPDEYLAIPYVMVMEPVLRHDGEWLRRASYPELPDCAVEAATALEAVEQLEQLRTRRIHELIARGAHVPIPRPPLRSVHAPDRTRDSDDGGVHAR